MTIARVTAHDGVGGSSAAFGGTPTSGNLLLALVGDLANSTTITGWTKIVSGIDSASNALSLFAKISAGSEGTITPSGSFITQTSLCEYSGAAATITQDGTAGATTTSAIVTSKVSAAITTTDAGSLVFLGGLMGGAATGISWSGGPTSILANTNSAERGVGGQYLPGTTVSAFTSTLSWTGPIDAVVLIAAFKPLSASGPANVKTIGGLAKASVKTVSGLAIASVKTIEGIS